MKIFKLLGIGVMMLMFASCAKASNAQGDESFAKVQAQENSGTPNILVPESDTQIRPGMAVDKVTVIDFNATWCGPCRALEPVFDMAAAEYAGKADFYSIDVDKYPQTANAFSVRGIPYVLIISPDGNVEEHVGLGDFLKGINVEKVSKDEAIEGMYTNMAQMINESLKK